jgi:hypothetical protein
MILDTVRLAAFRVVTFMRTENMLVVVRALEAYTFPCTYRDVPDEFVVPIPIHPEVPKRLETLIVAALRVVVPTLPNEADPAPIIVPEK